MKQYWITYKTESSCRKCPPDEHEQLAQEYDDRILTYEDGKPVIYNNWVELLNSLPTDNVVEIKEVV